jgi:hypothetical protein
MPEVCTCGTQLPPDARFCYKCGKPQREEMQVELPDTPSTKLTADTLVAAQPGAPSFRHPVAVRVGLFAASVATFLCLALPFGFVIWLPAGGFISVYLFSRRTGQSLSVRNGARMGWIAGILSFLIITVIFTIMGVALANRPGGLHDAFNEALKSRNVSQEQLEKSLELLANPVNLATAYVSFLLLSFMATSVFCTAGGALGAKVLDKG